MSMLRSGKQNSHQSLTFQKILNLELLHAMPLDAYSTPFQTHTPALQVLFSSSEKWDYSHLTLAKKFVRVMEGELGGSWRFPSCSRFHTLALQKLSFTGSLLPGRAGSDNLQLLARHQVSQISVAWRLLA